MSDYLSKGNHEEGTEMVQAHILHGVAPGASAKPAGFGYQTFEKPSRTGYPKAADDGAGFNYTPPGQAGHKV